MILEFDYEKKTVTIKEKLKLSQLNEAMIGKEDWDIIQEPQVVKEYVYQYYPYQPIVTTYGNPYTTTYSTSDSVTLTNLSSN